MIARNLHGLKVEKTSQFLTSYAGLPLLTELAHQLGLIEDLDAIPGLWERRGAYCSSDYLMSLALTLIAGGEGLDDVRLLRCDPGLHQLSLPDVPASNSLGDFLRRFTQRTIHKLSQVNSRQVRRFLERSSFKQLTLDIDSTLIESDKKEARTTYKGFEGYNPLLAWLAEPDMLLAGVFRPGNASPQSHILGLLKHCVRRLPQGVALRFRADSAAYQLAVMGYCVSKGIRFAIGADLDTSVREVIEKIPDDKWRLVVRGNDSFLLAETVHAPGSGSAQPLPSFRLIVTRRLSGQLALFKEALDYHVIITDLPESMSTEQALEFYNARGTAEKALGETKNGFGLHWLPCATLMANAAYFQVILLAYNLVQTFKHQALPEGWRKFGVKNLRFRLLCQAGLVVRHARRLVLKLSEGFPFFETFEKARWAVLSPCLVT